MSNNQQWIHQKNAREIASSRQLIIHPEIFQDLSSHTISFLKPIIKNAIALTNDRIRQTTSSRHPPARVVHDKISCVDDSQGCTFGA